jgi:thiol-disulfide isomerase/thioredoxin
MIREISKILKRSNENTLIYKMLLGHLAYKTDVSKVMSFDRFGNSITNEKVFIYLADSFIINGHAKGVYTDETVKAIAKKANRNRHLLPGAKAPDFFVIDTTHAKDIAKYRFDTCKTSLSLSQLYYANEARIKPMYKSLYGVNAKYTILVFWASDCGHCRTDIPKLNENLKKLKGTVDYKVFAVQTKEDYEAWRKFIIENNLDFINVYDPVHLNSFAEKYDVESTPVIFLLDKDKKIRAKRIGVDQVTELLEMFEKIEKEQMK